MSIRKIFFAFVLVFVAYSLAFSQGYQYQKLDLGAGLELTIAEYNSLPEYVQAKISGQSHPRWNYWNKRIGPAFIHLHHYACGLVRLSRGKGAYSSTSKSYLKNAVQDFDYMLRSTENSFFLRYHFHYCKGEALYELGDYDNALIEYQKSIQLNKSNPMPYVRLYGIYVHYGLNDKAEDIQQQMEANCGTNPKPNE